MDRKIRNKDDETRKEGTFKRVVAIAVVLFIVICAAVIYFSDQGSYVAKVGNEKITKAEFLLLFNQEKQYMMNFFGITEDEATGFWSTIIEGEPALDYVKKSALNMAWESKIHSMKAKERGLKLTNEERKAIENALDQELSVSLKTRQAKDEFFKTYYGITYNEFKKTYCEHFVITDFITAVYEEMEVTEDQIKQHYDENRDSIDWAKVRHILVYVDEEASEEDKEAARKKAEEILEKVNNGEDFAELNAQYSDDYNPGNPDGEYSFTRDGDYVEEFKAWAFENEEGDTGIVETQFGYHIMELLECEKTYDELKGEAELSLKNKLFRDMNEEWKKQPEYKLVKNDRVYNDIS